MAVIWEWTEELREKWREWLAGRPPAIVALAERFPPNVLFRMKSTGHRVQILSYGEDGTLRVSVDGRFNRVIFSREVFGVAADDLVECDLPAVGEDVGDTSAEAGYSDEDVKNILIPKMIEDMERRKKS